MPSSAPRVHPLRMRGQAWSSTGLLPASRVPVVSLSEAVLRAGRAAGEKVACFLLSHRISGLAHRGVERHSRSLHATWERRTHYAAIHRILFVVALSLVVSMMPIGLAVSAPAGQPASGTRPPHLCRIGMAPSSSCASGHWCPKRSS